MWVWPYVSGWLVVVAMCFFLDCFDGVGMMVVESSFYGVLTVLLAMFYGFWKK